MTNPAVVCGNCDWEGKETQLGRTLTEVHHLWERLNPGSEVPAGECARCGCFAYLKEPAPGTPREKLEQLRSTRFAVFYGSNYYPLGGAGDFKASFASSELAQAFAEGCMLGGGCDWWQVVDLETMTIIVQHEG
jgi:hypothetical protein